MKLITENKIEQSAIEILQTFGWDYIHGLAIAPGAKQRVLESENNRLEILFNLINNMEKNWIKKGFISYK